MCFRGWEVSPRAGPVLLHLVDQEEGSLGWMGQQHPLRAAPGKGPLNGKLPASPSMRGLGQDGVGRASGRRPVVWAFLVTQSLKKCRLALIPSLEGIRGWLLHEGRSQVQGAVPTGM